MGYRSWAQVAGYFDGDGCVLIRPRKYAIAFAIEWADTSLPQIKQL